MTESRVLYGSAALRAIGDIPIPGVLLTDAEMVSAWERLRAALFERPTFEDWVAEEGLLVDTTPALVAAYGFYLEAMERLGRDTTTRWED